MYVVIASSGVNISACKFLAKKVDFLSLQGVSISLELYWISENYRSLLMVLEHCGVISVCTSQVMCGNFLLLFSLSFTSLLMVVSELISFLHSSSSFNLLFSVLFLYISVLTLGIYKYCFHLCFFPPSFTSVVGNLKFWKHLFCAVCGTIWCFCYPDYYTSDWYEQCVCLVAENVVSLFSSDLVRISQ